MRNALPHDEEILKIPAFLRKKTLRLRAASPLLLTALDRKKAKKKRGKRVTKVSQTTLFSQPTVSAKPEEARRVRRSRSRLRVSRHASFNQAPTFAEPLIGIPTARPTPMPAAARNPQRIGTITHFYQKISVAVVALTGTLRVGDTILFEAMDGTQTHILDSMEINRNPVFAAGRGDDIGIKIKGMPQSNSPVYLL